MVERNPKDSMKSTWRQQARSEWTLAHWFYELTDVHPEHLDQEVPVHLKEDGVPYVPDWSMHRWVIVHSVIPLLLQQAYIRYTGHNFGPLVAFVFYSLAFKATAIHELHVLRRLGHIHGFLDGDKHARDGVPDVGAAKVVRSLLSTSTFRPMFSVFLAYRTKETPADVSIPWLLLEISLYGIILDFWFYWYHRIMHDFESMWKYHRTHHLTKHPNPLLTLYADLEQELFDIAGIPLMTYFSMKLMGMPMGFYEWWICHMYVMYAELAGHSGLRVHATPPCTLSWLLRYFNAELVIEDHDLHHRKGWKKSYNYGKQTRLWDRIFGTCCDRIESVNHNVDYVNQSPMPLI
ncbi:Fatty acid hydroxylase vlmA [Penicillium angulare]|uniref:Fatty acid hydroxylase vlmA n=1 Tax=Penicillium angulare TaxID=116970 RepID=A0A9W9FYX5_9EURO|nr:Fatty acid hydroxylase vlmA [Penicillium angulare]